MTLSASPPVAAPPAGSGCEGTRTHPRPKGPTPPGPPRPPWRRHMHILGRRRTRPSGSYRRTPCSTRGGISRLDASVTGYDVCGAIAGTGTVSGVVSCQQGATCPVRSPVLTSRRAATSGGAAVDALDPVEQFPVGPQHALGLVDEGVGVGLGEARLDQLARVRGVLDVAPVVQGEVARGLALAEAVAVDQAGTLGLGNRGLAGLD